jgi:hypothetical protein
VDTKFSQNEISRICLIIYCKKLAEFGRYEIYQNFIIISKNDQNFCEIFPKFGLIPVEFCFAKLRQNFFLRKFRIHPSVRAIGQAFTADLLYIPPELLPYQLILCSPGVPYLVGIFIIFAEMLKRATIEEIGLLPITGKHTVCNDTFM